MPNNCSPGFDANSNPLPRLYPDSQNSAVRHMSEKLQEEGVKFKVHYMPQHHPTNPFYNIEAEDEDVSNAIAACDRMINLHADFGKEIKKRIRTIVVGARMAGYAVASPTVTSRIYSLACAAASDETTTQMASHQNNYGCYNSDEHKLPSH